MRDFWSRHAEVRVLTIAVLCVLLWLVLVRVVDAATLTPSWTLPTTNTDGSTIPATGPGSLTGTRVQYGSCSGTAFGVMTAERLVVAPATTTVFDNIDPGTYCVRAYARNTYNMESVASNVASKVIPAPVPGAPVITTIATTAYEIRPTKSGIHLALVGTIALGSQCEMQASGGLWFVDPALVALKGNYRGGAVVARCG